MVVKNLIDVDEAIEKINGLCVDSNENWIGNDNQSFVDHGDVIDILADMPVVEVVQGRWIEEYVYDPDPHDRLRYKCSVCGRTEEYREPYCNCGAKMDGDNIG